jgi:hypothetical protein
MREEEMEAFEERAREQEKLAERNGFGDTLRKFEGAVAQSVAVICRSLGKVSELVSNDNELFATFYQLVGADARLPENNEWDRIRQAVESLLFPFYFTEIRFACLSLDGRGVSYYGGYCVTLKDASIRDRASVFEENCVVFMRGRRIADPLPVGYRAGWAKRGRLAVAKLGSKVSSRTLIGDFPSLLVNAAQAEPDFVEVHIFGPVNRRAIARVVGMIPSRRQDKALLKSLKRKLGEVGAVLEIER